MNSTQYYAYLKECLKPTKSEQESLIRQQLDWGKVRARQFDDPEFINKYRELSDQDTIEAQTKYFDDMLLKPLLEVMPSEVKDRLEKVTIGVLPTRSVNACATKSPNGEPLIIIDSGLMSMAHFYLEIKPTVAVIAQNYGMDASVSYIENAYKFIIHYYGSNGEMGFPLPDPGIKIPPDYILQSTLQTMALEKFVLCHELAHIYAGHLDQSSTKPCNMAQLQDKPVEFYQKSWAQEFEADIIGWAWYQLAWQSNPTLGLLPPVPGKLAPLYFFELSALVERNTATQNQYSSHPPAAQRMAVLVAWLKKQGNEDIIELAIEMLKTTAHMPEIKI